MVISFYPFDVNKFTKTIIFPIMSMHLKRLFLWAVASNHKISEINTHLSVNVLKKNGYICKKKQSLSVFSV